MQDTQAFAPFYKVSQPSGSQGGTFYASTTVTANVTAATSSGPFSGAQVPGQNQIRVANKTTAWAHINFGVSENLTAATVAASPPVAPGAVEVFTADSEVNAASVILDAASTGSSSVVFTRGGGV